MLGSQLRKDGSRFNVADRFSDTRENLRLSAVVVRTVHVAPQQFSMPHMTASKGRSPDQGGASGDAEWPGLPPLKEDNPGGTGLPGRDVAATSGRSKLSLGTVGLQNSLPHR